jgi:hypothetical protein
MGHVISTVVYNHDFSLLNRQGDIRYISYFQVHKIDNPSNLEKRFEMVDDSKDESR